MKTLFLTGALAFASASLFANAATSADGSSEHAGYALQTNPMTGGDGTVNQSDNNAFSLPQGNLSMTKRLDFSVGNSFFRNPWVEAPASTQARDGLGPLLNTNTCQGCHVKDGRGHPPAVDTPSVSLFLRLAVPHDPVEDADILRTNGFKPHPVYGAQLQTSALPGAKPEADMILSWTSRVDVLADGTGVDLREPVYTIENPNYGPLGDDLLISPRVAPPMIGMGLLEAIPSETVAALADPNDANNDGISGKVNQVWDIASGQTVAGRFGWKAAEPDVHQQSMGAFAGDMGLTSSLKTATDCTPSQNCGDWANGGEPEVTDKIADFVTFYSKSLAIPARRDMDSAIVQQGAMLFNETGCAACHTPTHVTGVDPQRPDLSNQTIWPYSDLLLHDMGPALADGRDEFLANGNDCQALQWLLLRNPEPLLNSRHA